MTQRVMVCIQWQLFHVLPLNEQISTINDIDSLLHRYSNSWQKVIRIHISRIFLNQLYPEIMRMKLTSSCGLKATSPRSASCACLLFNIKAVMALLLQAKAAIFVTWIVFILREISVISVGIHKRHIYHGFREALTSPKCNRRTILA